jgi:hypothetical protein
MVGSQSHESPNEQHPGPGQVVVPVELLPSWQMAPSESGVHENGWQVQLPFVAVGQPYVAQHRPPPLMPAVLHVYPLGEPTSQ